MLRFGLGGLLLAGVVWLNWHDLAGMGGALRQAPAAIAVSVLVHVPQIVLTALAWRALLPSGQRPSAPAMARLRWVREALNSLVPAGALLGQTVAALQIARAGVAADVAAATATVDVTVEGATQALITIAGLTLLSGNASGQVPGWAFAAGAAASVAAIALLLAVQRHLPAGLIERAVRRAAPRWSAARPGWMRQFQAGILRVHAGRGALARAGGLHLLAWAIGAVEVAGVLALLGHPVSLAQGFMVESVTQALRSVAFAIPGALGVQEGAMVAACALIGVPAGPALSMALLRRARELLVGFAGLLALRRLRAGRGD